MRSYLTVNSGVAEGTGALVCSVTVEARAAIEAGLGVTLVDVILAVAAGESRQAETGEGVDAVHTGAPVEAGAEASHGINCYESFSSERMTAEQMQFYGAVGYLSVQSLVLISQFMPLKPGGQVQV